MREKLNNDPRTQIIVLAVAAVVFVLVLFTMVLKGDPEVPPPATDPAAEILPEAGAAPAVDPATGAAPAPEAAVPVTPATPPATGGADGLLAGKGLPKDVLVAYARNKALALVVVDPKGLADKKLGVYTERLGSQPGVEAFVIPVDDIAKYARITQGVDVSRTPALVVVTPRDKSDEVPTASVSYGFRSPKSVEIALQDALYDGKNVTSFPK